MTTLYALRHKATGFHMPQMKGVSWWEPTLDDHRKLKPRLFWTKRSVQNSRSAWARGPWGRENVQSLDWEGVPDGWDETVPMSPMVPRHLDDLEIIELTLAEEPSK